MTNHLWNEKSPSKCWGIYTKRCWHAFTIRKTRSFWDWACIGLWRQICQTKIAWNSKGIRKKGNVWYSVYCCYLGHSPTLDRLSSDYSLVSKTINTAAQRSSAARSAGGWWVNSLRNSLSPLKVHREECNDRERAKYSLRLGSTTAVLQDDGTLTVRQSGPPYSKRIALSTNVQLHIEQSGIVSSLSWAKLRKPGRRTSFYLQKALLKCFPPTH